MGKAFLIASIIITLIGIVFGLATQIEWATYIGLSLTILFGSAGAAFLAKRFEAIIGGVVISVLLPVLLSTIQAI